MSVFTKWRYLNNAKLYCTSMVLGFLLLPNVASANSNDLASNASYSPEDQQQFHSTTFRIKGRVIDEDRKPVIGAAIAVKGTSHGVITNVDGEFTLFRIAPGQTLEFSYIGKESFTYVVKEEEENLVVTLKDAAYGIDDVVVTGYQTVSARESASATTRLKMKDIEIIGNPTLSQMLQGTVGSMAVINTSGEPSATPKIRIRGNSTLSGNQSPVWVVDGIILEQAVPFNTNDITSDDAEYLIGNAIAGLNPRDIESITVLKDASATAIYGVKAANGVIVITTKRGDVSAPQVSYSGDMTITERPSYARLDRMNSAQRVQLSSEIAHSGIQYPRIPTGDTYEGILNQLYSRDITQEEFDSRIIQIQGRNTDWFKELFRNSISHSHAVNVAGGTEAVRYYFSAGYNESLGAAKGSDSKRFNGLGKVDVKLNKAIDFTVKVDFNSSQNSGFIGSVNPYNYAYNTSRTLAAYNPDGAYSYYTLGYSTPYNYSFLNELDQTGRTSTVDNIGSLFNINIKLWKGLKYTGTASYNISNSSGREWMTDRSYSVALIRGYNYKQYADTDSQYSDSALPYGGVLSLNNIRSTNYTVRNMLQYSEMFNDIHSVNIMGGTEIRSTKYVGSYATGYGWIPEFGEMFNPVYTDRYVSNYVRTGSTLPTITNQITQVASFFGTASYSYDDRYILNANLRSDGANKFGSNPNYRWLPTWSVAGKWNITSESFMKEQNIFDYLAVRASYGIQGNIHDNSNPELIVKISSNDALSGQQQMVIDRLPNPDLRWEKTKSWNAGLDFSFLDNRIRGDMNIYGKYTTDLIIDITVPASTGRSLLYINGGKMENFGIEGNIVADAYKSKNLDWRVSLVMGHNKNKITYASGSMGELESVRRMLNGNLAISGDAAGSLYSFDYKGLSSENGYPLYMSTEGNLVHTGEMDMINLVNSGSIYPTISGGFGTEFKIYKQFLLSFNFTYSLGAVGRLPNYYDSQYVFDPIKNVSVDALYRWRKPGDEAFTDIPALIDRTITDEFYRNGMVASRPGSLSYENLNTVYGYSSNRVAKTDYLRFKSIGLSYNLPDKFTKKQKITSATIRLQATNLALWTDERWKGLDPETPYSNVPILPTFSIGLNVTL